MSTKFWSTLFNDGEDIVIAKDVQDTRSVYTLPLHCEPINPFFCINALAGGRTDLHVTSFRNILIEFDNMSLIEQSAYVHEQKMPFSTVVFSGNKSYHYIISLDIPMLNLQSYKKIVNRIYNKMSKADKSTKNASRLSRTPNAVRDGGAVQELLLVKDRIKLADLEAWLGPDLKTEESNPIVTAPMGPGKRRLLPVRVLAFIEYGAQEGGRNRALFTNACELFRAGFDKEEVFEIAMKVLDLPVAEIRQCIASAQKAVSNEVV